MVTLKARGILIEGSINELREELYLTRREIQNIVDALWELDKIPNISQTHQMLYWNLRRKGFRPHQAKQIYKYARALILAVISQFRENFYRETLEWCFELLPKKKQSLRKRVYEVAEEIANIVYEELLRNRQARNANLRKPTLRKLMARLDKYDARIDLEEQVIVLKLRNRVFKIKLLHRKEYLEKFIGKKWYEVMVSVDRKGRIWISIPFRWKYKPYKPKGLVSLDINLKKIVVFNGRSIRRINTRFMDALSLKIRAERIQKKYPRMWRYSKRILGRIRKLHRRSRNIVADWSRKFAKYIVLKARRTRSAIVLEDLEKLWFNTFRKSSSLANKLSRFAYRKLQLAIITKAIEYNVLIIFVNPRNTSTTCPRCGAKLSYNYRLAMCRKCGFIADRDTIGAMNIHLRAHRRMYPSLGSRANAPPMNDEARGKGRTIHEPMTVHIKSYTNI